MDELRRHAAPLVERWQRLARSQRLAMAAMFAASVVGFLFLIQRDTADWQPICEGREFAAQEISAIQTSWRERGLKNFRRNGNTLSVPKADLARYEAALPKSGTDEAASGTEWDKQLSKTNLFTSHEELEQRKEIALRNELRRHLEAIPAIAKADVIWARSRGRSTFASRSKVTATINVTPRDGHDLTPELAQSLRTAVARMVPDLSEEDITVLDQSTGLTVTDETDDLIVEQQRRQPERFARQLESRIAAALTHVPGASVDAHWIATSVPESMPTARHVTARPTFGLTPDWLHEPSDKLVDFTTDTHSTCESPCSAAWHITARIPQAYFDAHAAQQLLATKHRPSTTIDDLRGAERDRLWQLIRSALPRGTPVAELAVIPVADTTVTLPASELRFAAWPHLACLVAAALCIVLTVLRPRLKHNEIRMRVDENSPANPANEQTRSATKLTEARTTIAGQEQEVVPVAEFDRASSDSRLTTAVVSDLVCLQQLDPQQLADALRHERPQAIAVLLTRFPTWLASACLSRLAQSLQTDVIRRLKSLGEVPDELVAEIARTVCQRSSPSVEATPPATNRIGHLLPDTSTRKALA